MTLRRKKISAVPPSVAYKWNRKVADEGFVPFPKRLLRSASFLFGPNGLSDLTVVLSIADYRRGDLDRPPSYEFLAFNAGMPVEEFKSRVAKLAANGWLKATGPDVAVDIQLDGLLRAIESATDDQGSAE